jgi:HEPN domain-containing protein
VKRRSQWSNLAQEWLGQAKADLDDLRRAVSEPPLSDRAIGFLAQQVMEKALKGAIAGRRVEPPRVHSLVLLADQVRVLYGLDQDPLCGPDLTLWATRFRYPGASPPPIEHEPVLAQAEDVVCMVEGLIERSSGR